MLNLSTWTWLIDFVALAASLWLGIYIVTRSPRSRVSWLAGLALWSLGGYFLDSFLHLHPPRSSSSTGGRVGASFSPPLSGFTLARCF